MTATSTPVPPSHQLEHRVEELVATELARLARRAPVLADDHLRLVQASLQDIIDRLLPARGRATASPQAVAALFDLEFA